MDLDQIRALLAVARRGSISRAARDLYRTQPAVSLKLRALEEELETMRRETTREAR